MRQSNHLRLVPFVQCVSVYAYTLVLQGWFVGVHVGRGGISLGVVLARQECGRGRGGGGSGFGAGWTDAPDPHIGMLAILTAVLYIFPVSFHLPAQKLGDKAN